MRERGHVAGSRIGCTILVEAFGLALTLTNGRFAIA